MTNNPPFPNDEHKRISALMRYRDLEFSEGLEFKSITELAADICNVPVALVSFVDVSNVHLKFSCGLEGVSSVPRDISFCHHTVMGTDPLIVEDTALDPRFKNSPVVTDNPKFRFYAGLPIVTPDDYVIGALCALDYKPNKLNTFQINSLQKLSKIVSKFLDSKLLESEKREQESHSRLFFKHAPVCIHGIDLKGCFTSMNPSGLEMLGLKYENQVRGTSYLSGVAEKDHDRIKNLLDKALQGEKSNFEFSGLSGNIFSSCFVPIKNLQGDVIRLMGISENITERKHAEEKLANEMKRLELVMRATNDSVWDMDKLTNTVWWNETYTNTFGRPPEENTWDWWLDRIHPKDKERVQTSLASVSVSDTDRWDEEYQFQKPDGSYAHVLDRAYIARDEAGQATRVLGAMRDITISKRAEQELREMNIALSHSLPGIARLDLDGCYTYVSKLYADLLGYQPDELIGQSWKVTVAPEDHEIGLHGYQRMLKEDNVEYDIKGVRKNGEAIYKHILISKRLNDDGEFIGHRCFMRDITEQVEADNKHKELQNELNHVARLNNMNEMATGLAHEVNQPLSALSHYCDAAKTLLEADTVDKEKFSAILQGASEQALRAGEIVRQCKQFTSKQTIEKCLINLNELTQETVRFLDIDIQDHNASIQVTLDENIPFVEIDKVQIQQVLVNLIRNGLEAMDNNRPRKLTVRTQLINGNNKKPSAQVSVQDTGRGLELPQIENLYQPFFTTKETGMGLGLSISRSIIEKHDGKLWLDTEHKPETLFHFTIPIPLS